MKKSNPLTKKRIAQLCDYPAESGRKIVTGGYPVGGDAGWIYLERQVDDKNKYVFMARFIEPDMQVHAMMSNFYTEKLGQEWCRAEAAFRRRRRNEIDACIIDLRRKNVLVIESVNFIISFHHDGRLVVGSSLFPEIMDLLTIRTRGKVVKVQMERNGKTYTAPMVVRNDADEKQIVQRFIDSVLPTMTDIGDPVTAMDTFKVKSISDVLLDTSG